MKLLISEVRLLQKSNFKKTCDARIPVSVLLLRKKRNTLKCMKGCIEMFRWVEISVDINFYVVAEFVVLNISRFCFFIPKLSKEESKK